MNENLVKALSVRQPWAHCLVHGLKRVENRSWRTRFRGHVLIHASQKFDKQGLEWVQSQGLLEGMTKSDFKTGGIVGEMTITDCVTEMDSMWFSGKYGFVVKDAKPLAFTPLKGKLSFFNVESSKLNDFKAGV